MKSGWNSNTTEADGPKGSFSKLAFILLIIVFVIVGFIGFALVRSLQTVGEATQPFSELVRGLVVEATPVIVPNPVIVIEEINSLARLETASYSFQDILQIERNQDLLFGAFGESLLFVAYGDVIAGVDLSQMAAEDIQIYGPTEVVVHLPAAEILVSDLDNERSYVANRDVGFFANADPELETLIRREAESRMVEAAMANGILQTADANAEAYMRSFLEGLGFEQITFVDETPAPAPPFEQEVPKGFALTPEATATPQ